MEELRPDILSDIERGERWLATQSTPAPTPEIISAAKSAARRELLISRQPARRLISPVIGVWAAAAMILLAVYVAWNASRTLGPVNSPSEPPLIAQLPAEIPQATESQANVLVAFDTRQKELEDWSKDANWDLAGSSLSAALNEIWAEPANSNTEKGKRSS
jgi:anti-sigma-K factor RskA